MTVRSHIAISFLPSAAVYLFTKSLLSVGAFLAGSVLIDVDHYVDHVYRTGGLSLRAAYDYGIELDNRLLRGERLPPVFHFLHTIEFLLAVAVLSFFVPAARWLFLGMAVHFAMDMYHITKDLHIGVRRYSLIRHLMAARRER